MTAAPHHDVMFRLGAGADVPCDGCVLCCKMMTPLRPEKGDDIAAYQTMTWLKPGGPVIVLDRKANGDCVYLIDGGCSIYAQRPYECRKFDCREHFKNSDRPGRKLAVKNGVMTKEIFERGRTLLGL